MSQPTASSVKLLIVDDDEEIREILAMRFRRQGMQVVQAGSGKEALEAIAEENFEVALLDIQLPDVSGIDLLSQLKEATPEMESLVLTAHGSVETAIEAMKRGAYDYLSKPIDFHQLEIRLEKACQKSRLQKRHRQWVEQLRYESNRYRLIGSSPQMHRVVEMIRKVAPTEATVLIRGASGTGKELVARAIHLNSNRQENPMVTINCAALQETLLESELFGHEKGAFTGAVQSKAGLFEVAEGGTLFVDEIGEMATGLQAKLLRVLEDGHYRRVGGTKDLKSDVRILAATNRDLKEAIDKGVFREDLFYRLNVFNIDLPPLRDRPEDIAEIVEHLLSVRAVGSIPFQIDPDAMEALSHYEWPGNVRELVNVLERAQIMAEERVITIEDLPDNVLDAHAHASEESPKRGSTALSEVERRHVQKILEQHDWNKVKAAKELGVSRRALYRLIEKHKLVNPRQEKGDS